MRNFRVGVNSEAFKMSTHQFQLTFVKDATLVDKLEIPDMKPNLFKFKEFSDILLGKFEGNVLVGKFSDSFCVLRIVCFEIPVN
jgi:hypothetical protein